MATSNYSWNLPTVGGSEDAWGTQLNANWTALDTLLGGTNSTEFAILDGATVTTTELNYLSGVTSNIQTQINTIAAAGSVPQGGIIMWSGSVASIPSGWFLCNGSNGTPDLRDRFVVGAGSSYAVGATGGEASVTLNAGQIPGHTHTFSGSTNTTGAHTHTIYFTNSPDGGPFRNLQGTGPSSDVSVTTNSAGDHSHTFSGTTSSTGGSGSHENRPPYYALAYIMKA